MKAEIYNALAALNRGFEVVLESLTILQNEGVLTADYVQDQTPFVEELRAGLNHLIIEKLETREAKDWGHFGRMKQTIEARMKE